MDRHGFYQLTHGRQAWDGILPQAGALEVRQGDARLNAYLEDYANVAGGLLSLYETTFEPRYYKINRERIGGAPELTRARLRAQSNPVGIQPFSIHAADFFGFPLTIGHH